MKKGKKILLFIIFILIIASLIYTLHTTSHIQYFFNKNFYTPLKLIEIYTGFEFSQNASIIDFEFTPRKNISGWSPYAETLYARIHIPQQEVTDTFQKSIRYYEESYLPSNPKFPLEGEFQFIVEDGGKVTAFEYWWASRTINCIVTKVDSEILQINLSIDLLGWKLWSDRDYFISWR